jgi:hypothetical protein
MLFIVLLVTYLCRQHLSKCGQPTLHQALHENNLDIMYLS